MTGNPKFCLMSRSRATVSLPCNCRISGCSASTILASVASSASTVSATFVARPLACLPSSRAVSRLRCRGEGGKNTNPTMSAPASSATSSVSRVDRPQILTIRDMASKHGLERWRRGRKGRCADGPGSTTSRPACLARRPHIRRPASGAGRRCGSQREAAALARRSASCARAARASASCWRAARRQWRCRNQVAEPPASHAHRHRDDDDEQRQRDRDRRIGGIERIERHRHQMTVGDREHDEDQAQRNQHQAVKNFRMTISRVDGDRMARTPKSREYAAGRRAIENALQAPASGAPPSRFSRSRISLPVLKNGTLF